MTALSCRTCTMKLNSKSTMNMRFLWPQFTKTPMLTRSEVICAHVQVDNLCNDTDLTEYEVDWEKEFESALQCTMDNMKRGVEVTCLRVASQHLDACTVTKHLVKFADEHDMESYMREGEEDYKRVDKEFGMASDSRLSVYLDLAYYHSHTCLMKVMDDMKLEVPYTARIVAKQGMERLHMICLYMFDVMREGWSTRRAINYLQDNFQRAMMRTVLSKFAPLIMKMWLHSCDPIGVSLHHLSDGNRVDIDKSLNYPAQMAALFQDNEFIRFLYTLNVGDTFDYKPRLVTLVRRTGNRDNTMHRLNTVHHNTVSP